MSSSSMLKEREREKNEVNGKSDVHASALGTHSREACLMTASGLLKVSA